MALNPQLSSGLRKALLELNEMRTLFDGGELHIFADDGTGQPADANTTESGGGTQLAVVDLPDGTTTQVQNGDFTTDTLWTKGTGWTISAGTASCDGTQAGDSDLTQASADLVAPLINCVEYEVTFTVSGYTAGNITPRVGGTLGTARNANGTYTETIAAGAGADIDFRGDVNFNGSIDNVSVVIHAFKQAANVSGITVTAQLNGDWDELAAVATGTGQWFRLYDSAVTTGASTTAVRADGTVGVGATFDLDISSVSISTGDPISVDTLDLGISNTD